MNHDNAVFRRVAELPELAPMPGVTARRLTGAQMMAQEVRVAAGVEVPLHSHANEQIMLMLDGRFEMTVHDAEGGEPRTFVMAKGDCVLLPAHCPHGGRAVEDALILDMFSPPSQATGINQGG